MKLRYLALTAVFATVLGAGQAHATVACTSIGDATTTLNISAGSKGCLDFGDISEDSMTTKIKGMLDSDVKVTFTYALSGTSAYPFNYEILSGIGDTGALAVKSTASTLAGGSASDSKSSADNLVLTSADLNLPALGGVTTITNLRSLAVSFASVFTALMAAGSHLVVYYSTEVVPLPAALPLFGLGLAGLAGAARKRKAKKAA